MAGETYSAKGIVLKKTRFGETDQIVRLLAEDGSMIECIAKGSRKPNSSLSARLELFNDVELLLAKGRSLDIVKECRLLESFERLRVDPLSFSAASCVAEFSSKIIQPGLECARLHDLTITALRALSSPGSDQNMPMLVAAYILKASTMVGMRPSFTSCVSCGSSINLGEEGIMRISLIDGGSVCDGCAGSSDSIPVHVGLISWAEHLLMSRFSELVQERMEPNVSIDLLQISHQWVISQFGFKLKAHKSLIEYSSI